MEKETFVIVCGYGKAKLTVPGQYTSVLNGLTPSRNLFLGKYDILWNFTIQIPLEIFVEMHMSVVTFSAGKVIRPKDMLWGHGSQVTLYILTILAYISVPRFQQSWEH